MTFDDHLSDREEAIARIRSLVDGDALAIADKVAAMNRRYVGLERDNDLAEALDAMVNSLTALDTAKPDKRRIVALLGRSGAGKTTALAKHSGEIQAMKPYVGPDGNEINPVLRFDAPSPCPPRRLAIEGLEQLGYPVSPNIKENEAWSLFRKMLKVHSVMVVIIDEAQHCVDTANSIEKTTIGNAFKQLTQSKDWPVRLIVAGVAPLAEFLGRKQLYNRRTVVTFERVDIQNDITMVDDMTSKIICDHASLLRHENLDQEFVKRLSHACDADVGSIVQMVRAAVEVAWNSKHTEVSIQHFVRVYKSFSGCQPSKNIFTAKDWEQLVPYQALLREEDRAWEASKRRKYKKKELQFGERPE